MPEIPEGATVPQDHKKPAKAKKPKKDRAAQTDAAIAEALGDDVAISHNGQTYRIDADAFDDVEVFGLIGRMQIADTKSASLYIPLIAERVMGPPQWAVWLELNRNDKGRVPASALGELWKLPGRLGGKPASLAWLLREHGEALEADFHEYYKLDLLDLYRGQCTVRKTSVLARGLPAGARVWAAMDSAAAWTAETHMGALLFDAVQFGNWQRAGGKGERPKPAHRPGAKSAEQIKAASAARRMARHQARQRRRREGGKTP